MSSSQVYDPTEEEPDEVRSLILHLLNLKCIYLFEEAINVLKNEKLLGDIKNYTKEAKIINTNKMLLTIVKSFTEMYFERVKQRFQVIVDQLSKHMSDEFTKDGTTLLNKCLIILEKRMFENLYHTLEEEPTYLLMVQNMYKIDFTKTTQTLIINEDREVEEVNDARSEGVLFSNINIFELVKFVFYNAVINAKKEVSRRIFNKYLRENVLVKFMKDKFQDDPCEEFLGRGKTDTKTLQSESKQEYNEDRKLKIAEYLIKNIWNHLPDLKLPILLKNQLFSEQLSGLIEDYKEDDFSVQEGEQNENIDWNYIVTNDNETLYVNAPTYKFETGFIPLIARSPQQEQMLTEGDFKKISKKRGSTQSKNSKYLSSCNADIFEKQLDAILNKELNLVGETLAPEEYRPTNNERMLSYIKIRNKVKKKKIMKRMIWEQFQKTYFSFEQADESEEPNEQCSYPVRAQEFYDLIPEILIKKVRPIDYEFKKTKYICAACGLFIDKGTGVQAMGYKWHDEHFKCRVCCENFRSEQDFVLYKGVVLCEYDADMILDVFATKREPAYKKGILVNPSQAR